MDFQAKEWSFLFRNGLIEHIGCKAGAMALAEILLKVALSTKN
jgi:hypothetical protein